jgi:hypothetical protein
MFGPWWEPFHNQSSRLSAAGVPDGFVSQMLGHAGSLLQTYSKAVDEYRREAIRRLEELRETNTCYRKASAPIPARAAWVPFEP